MNKVIIILLGGMLSVIACQNDAIAKITVSTEGLEKGIKDDQDELEKDQQHYYKSIKPKKNINVESPNVYQPCNSNETCFEIIETRVDFWGSKKIKIRCKKGSNYNQVFDFCQNKDTGKWTNDCYGAFPMDWGPLRKIGNGCCD